MKDKTIEYGVLKMGGKLLIAGGSLKKSKEKIHKLFIEYAGGINSKIAIIPTASGSDPKSTIKMSKAYG